MRSIKLENAGHVWGKQQVVRGGGITEPSFNYINQVALNSGMGRLSQELSYSQAVTAMELKQGRNSLAEADAQTRAAGIEAQYADEVMQQVAKKANQVVLQNKEETQRKISILERQKGFFDSVTTSNILSEYNEKMLQARQSDLENNPSGAGHMQRMAGAHDALVSEYLSGSYDPAVKSRLIPTFKESGARIANQAFNEEQTRTAATAELQLEGALERATLHIANGMNPEQALGELDPIMESIPNSLPGKERMLKQARNELIEFSLKRTALVNPWLAERNMHMESGMYAELTPKQRLHLESVIVAKKRDLEDEAEKRNQDALRIQITAQDGPIWEKKNKIEEGTYRFADLEADKAFLNKSQYEFLLRNIEKFNTAEALAKAKQIYIATRHNQDGNYYSFDKSVQNEIWLERCQTNNFEYHGEPANNSNIMQAKAQALRDFNVTIPIIKRDLKVSMLHGTAEQAMDAVLAFRELYATNRIILIGNNAQNDVEINAMLDFSTMMEDGVTIEEAQKKAREDLAPIFVEEKKKLEESFNSDFSDNTRSRKPYFSRDMLNTALKSYGVEFDEGDFIGPRIAEDLTRSYYTATRGDKVRALQMTVSAVNSSYRPSTVNGPGAEDYRMWQSPEGLFAGKGYDDATIRRTFCTKAAELASHSIGVEEGWLEILPTEKDKPNQCIWHNPNGMREAGVFWFEHKPGSVGKYRIKYNTKRVWGVSEALDTERILDVEYKRGANTGFVLECEVNGVKKEAIIDIDELDWNITQLEEDK